MPIFECSRCNDLTYSASPDAVRACERCDGSRHRVVMGSFADARRNLRDLAAGDHAALCFDDPDLVAPFCARYLTEGIDSGTAVMAALAPGLRAPIEALLGPDVAAAIDWRDAHEVYADFDPERIAASYDELLGGEPRRMRILAVFDATCARGVDPDEWARYERLGHEVLLRHGAIGVCMYDMRGLDEDFLRAAMHVHPLAVDSGSVRRNERFEYVPAA